MRIEPIRTWFLASMHKVLQILQGQDLLPIINKFTHDGIEKFYSFLRFWLHEKGYDL